MNKSVGILGTGSYVPEKVLTNFDLEKMVDTTDEWIQTRTGIKERRIAREDEASSDMGAEAAKIALHAAKIKPTDVPLIIVATITPDHQFPATACLLQHKLGAKNAAAFDLSAACSGFIYGLETARQFVLSGKYNNVLVVGAEKMSSVIDWTDRNICVLLGDGAGACVVGETQNGTGIIDSFLSADGKYSGLITLPAGGSKMPASLDTIKEKLHFMKMEGRDVFKHAVTIMSSACLEALERCSLTINDIDWIIPHQANIRIINAAAERLKIPMDKVYTNLDRYGNMSSASIPVALDEGIRNGSIKKGQKILLIAFGSGLTWGASIIKL
jgi:3-oxoacyl-[acyl-carrier-protein] synthase-3